MIHIFNRKELLLSYDLRQVNNLREILRANRIDYHVKYPIPDQLLPLVQEEHGPLPFGPVRQQERFTVYVHKADYDRAMYLLRNR